MPNNNKEYVSEDGVAHMRDTANDDGKLHETKVFGGGATRVEPKVQPHWASLPLRGLRRVALVFTEGDARYGPDNWRKGLPKENFIEHALEHIYRYKQGDRSEDHIAKVGWAVLCMLELFPDDIEDVQYIFKSLSDDIDVAL